jgi:tetratricopeptide (TPR) repeat protein
MSPAVLKRFVLLMATALVVVMVLFAFFGGFLSEEPGDYYTRKGDNRLSEAKFEEAIESFNLALDEAPNHRGALMGRALVFIQTERYDEAIAELDYLIDHLVKTLSPEDPTGRGALAAAYANRGIIRDRAGEHEKALYDYAAALKVDEPVTEGANVFDQVLYGYNPVTVRERAIYLQEQLALPEDQRLLSVPELDERQRMHKP